MRFAVARTDAGLVIFNTDTGDTETCIDKVAGKVNPALDNVFNLKIDRHPDKADDIQPLYGTWYGLDKKIHSIKGLIERNYIVRELLVGDKLAGYEFIRANLDRERSIVYWTVHRETATKTLAIHYKHKFVNVKRYNHKGSIRLIPKYGTFKTVQLKDNTPVNKPDVTHDVNESISIDETNKVITKIEQRLSTRAQRDKLSYIKNKMRRGFSNKSLMLAMTLVLGIAAAGAGGTQLYNRNDAPKVQNTVGTQLSAPKTSLDAAIRIHNSQTVDVTSDNKIMVGGVYCGTLQRDKDSFILNSNFNEAISTFKDNSLYGMISTNGIFPESKSTLMGYNYYTCSIKNKEYTIKSTGIKCGDDIVYKVSNTKNGMTITREVNSDITMEEAVTMIVGVKDYNEWLKIENMKAE